MKKVNPNENMIALRAARNAAENKIKEDKKRIEEAQANRENQKLGGQMQIAAKMAAVKLEGIAKSGIGIKKAEGDDFGGMKALEVKRNVVEKKKVEDKVKVDVSGGGGAGGVMQEKTVKVAMDNGSDSDEDSDDDCGPPPIF